MMVSRRTSLMPNFSVWMQSSDLITFNNCLCVNKQSTATMLSIINVTPSTVEKIGVMQQSVTFSGKSDERECRTFFMLFALPFFSSPVPWLEYDIEVLSLISYLSREESKQMNDFFSWPSQADIQWRHICATLLKMIPMKDPINKCWTLIVRHSWNVEICTK